MLVVIDKVTLIIIETSITIFTVLANIVNIAVPVDLFIVPSFFMMKDVILGVTVAAFFVRFRFIFTAVGMNG